MTKANLFLALLLVALLHLPLPKVFVSASNHENNTANNVKAQVQELAAQAFAQGTPENQKEGLWRRVLELDPRNGNAMMHLGLQFIGSPYLALRDQGADMVARAFDPVYVDEPIPMPSSGGMRLAMFLGRLRWEQRDFMPAFYYYQLALRASESMSPQEQVPSQLCIQASLATMLHPFPNSTDQADRMYKHYTKSARQFLQARRAQKKERGTLPTMDQANSAYLANFIPGGDEPYVHCVLTLFQLSFYYRANTAEAARLYHQVTTNIWPELKYQSRQAVKKKPTTPPHLDQNKPCTTKKIQLGIASGFLTPGSSVSADFGGVLQRLNRDIFNVTYIHFQNNTASLTDPFVHRHEGQDTLLLFSREMPQDSANGAYVKRFYAPIEALDLDLLVYLDLTMSPFATRMSMARLAPVQANSHGHPVTSGVKNVDYYISWGAAELDWEAANTHYSEELILLDSKVPHQYYTPRHKNGQSMMDGGFFKDKSNRSYFRRYMTPKGSLGGALFNDQQSSNDNMDSSHEVQWYTCMQKPHKFMPEMDPLLCDVLKEDRNGILILHQPDTAKMFQSFEKRLEAAHCDMERVYFVPVLLHHELMALYSVSTLILDSYPAGGCTTTREVLELQKVVVTWPARLLGGRWSFAYYQILNDDVLKQHVIATSHNDYVQKAAQLGKDASLRKEMEFRIGRSLPNLYHRDDAVRSWEEVLLKISPVEKRDSCDADGSSGDASGGL